jgi:ribosomal protein S18 acetylase RimI-like enzyme
MSSGISEIKKVKTEHLQELIEISRKTFQETYGAYNTAEKMEIYLHQNLSSDQLLNEINATNSEFYHLYYQSKLVGFIKIGFTKAPKTDEPGLEIERIYLLSEFQGLGLGKILLNHCFEIAKQNNIQLIWLGVWENNLKAQEFYLKAGFKSFGEHIFKLGNDEQRDLLVIKKL